MPDEESAGPVVIQMQNEGVAEEPRRRIGMFGRLFRSRNQARPTQPMTEFDAEEWLTTRNPQEHSNEAGIDEETFTKSTVKLEAILLAVNLVRSPIKVELKDDTWNLSCFTDGTNPYRLEVWQENLLKASIEKEPGLASECFLSFPAVSEEESKAVAEDVVMQEMKLALVVRTIQPVSPIIAQGRMMAGVQVTNILVIPSRDGASHEAKLESQKILISNFEMDLYEIFGQPHSILPAVEASVNRSQTSFFSAGNCSDLPGYNRECVICLSQRRDTLFLPCRHMCLCLHCAESLCMHSDKCPICRQEFRSMLSINDA